MFSSATRMIITACFVLAAVCCGRWVWKHYLYEPWTRDGRIRAEVITVAPDVSGWITHVNFRDNEEVKKGQTLFTIDDVRFKNALNESHAKLDKTYYAWEHAKEQLARRQNLIKSSVISKEDLSTYSTNTRLAKADYDLANSNYEKALIDLHRTVIRAPADGVVMNLDLREGNYVSQGKSVLSLIRANSMYVTGYFEETKLPGVKAGNSALIHLMSGGVPLTGTVTSIARGIANNNNKADNQLLPDTQQSFNWVRLAQRIPVDIRLNPVPKGIILSAGMTVSVEIIDNERSK